MSDTVEVDRKTLAILSDETQSLLDSIKKPGVEGTYWEEVELAVHDAEDALQGGESER